MKKQTTSALLGVLMIAVIGPAHVEVAHAIEEDVVKSDLCWRNIDGTIECEGDLTLEEFCSGGYDTGGSEDLCYGGHSGSSGSGSGSSGSGSGSNSGSSSSRGGKRNAEPENGDSCTIQKHGRMPARTGVWHNGECIDEDDVPPPDGTPCTAIPAMGLGGQSIPGKYEDGECRVDHEATQRQIDSNTAAAKIAVDLLCEYDTKAMAVGAAAQASEKWVKYGLKIARIGRTVTIVGAASHVIVCPIVDAFD